MSLVQSDSDSALPSPAKTPTPPKAESIIEPISVDNLTSSHVGKIGSRLRGQPSFDHWNRGRALTSLFAVVLLVVDLLTDIAVVITLSQAAHSSAFDKYSNDVAWWFILTLVLLLVPAFLVNAISLVWLFRKKYPGKAKLSKGEKFFVIVMHALLLGQIVRHAYIVRAGREERRSAKTAPESVVGPYCVAPNGKPSRMLEMYTLRKLYERDLAFLDLMDTFLQDAPQLTLQLYILVVIHTDAFVKETSLVTSLAALQIVSVIISLVSLSWTLATLKQAFRWSHPELPKASLLATVSQLAWRFCTVASRVTVLAVFAAGYPKELFLFGGLHWLLMTTWVILMGTSFCTNDAGKSRPALEVLFDVTISWVLIFDFLHVDRRATRYKMAAYYTLIAAEGAGLLYAWDHRMADENAEWFHITVLVFVPVAFVLGLLFLTIYYRRLHPEGKMPSPLQKASLF